MYVEFNFACVSIFHLELESGSIMAGNCFTGIYSVCVISAEFIIEAPRNSIYWPNKYWQLRMGINTIPKIFVLSKHWAYNR